MKLTIRVKCHVPEEDRERNTKASVGWPEPKGSGHLAVVGGGPSVRDALSRLETWPGEIWAINGTWRWLKDHGIEATYFSCDPADDSSLIRGAQRAVLAAHCHPNMFKAAPETYRWSGETYGTTTATAATIIAPRCGFSEVTFFGCGSSYTNITHVYQAEETQHYLLIRCNGQEFLTKPEFLLQAEQLAAAIRAAPNVFHEESGGLLRAMIADPDWDAIAGSRNLVKSAELKVGA